MWQRAWQADLISLVVSRHGDAGGSDGCQVRTDLIQTQRGLHALLCTMHQHLLELHKHTTYIHTYIHIYIHTYIHTYIYTYIQHRCTHNHMHTENYMIIT